MGRKLAATLAPPPWARAVTACIEALTTGANEDRAAQVHAALQLATRVVEAHARHDKYTPIYAKLVGLTALAWWRGAHSETLLAAEEYRKQLQSKFGNAVVPVRWSALASAIAPATVRAASAAEKIRALDRAKKMAPSALREQRATHREDLLQSLSFIVLRLRTDGRELEVWNAPGRGRPAPVSNPATAIEQFADELITAGPPRKEKPTSLLLHVARGCCALAHLHDRSAKTLRTEIERVFRNNPALLGR
jgi:hypothetical protein